MSTMIETDNLGRYFGEIRAVDGISFRVGQGEVLGFLGPNGAGKSTTMKMITCFLTPSFGTARVAGFDIASEQREVRTQIGYLPENAPLYGEMTVNWFLEFIAEIRRIPPARRQDAIDRVVQMTSLEGVINQRIETLSKGFKRRVGLAQALIHDPKILILDEPTDGLDPNQKHEVRQLINNMAKDKCIILSTHILEEVDEVCTRAVIIAKGKLLVDATPDELRARSRSHGAVAIDFRQGAVPGNALSQLRGLTGVREVAERKLSGGQVSFTLYPKDRGDSMLFSLLREAEKQQWKMDNLRMETGQLDEVFRQITQ